MDVTQCFDIYFGWQVPATDIIIKRIVGNPVEPGRKSRYGAERTDMEPRFYEGVLRQILAQLFVAAGQMEEKRRTGD